MCLGREDYSRSSGVDVSPRASAGSAGTDAAPTGVLSNDQDDLQDKALTPEDGSSRISNQGHATDHDGLKQSAAINGRYSNRQSSDAGPRVPEDQGPPGVPEDQGPPKRGRERPKRAVRPPERYM